MTNQSKKANKFLASTMTAAIVASAIAPTAGFAASNFTDVQADNFYYNYVSALSNADIIDGRPDGTFDLGGKINRAEASKMVANILKLNAETAPKADFTDVDQSKWYAGYINALFAEELIGGKGEGKFDPNGALTRGEFAKMVVEAYELTLNENGPEANFTDVDEDKWYADYINILFSHGLVSGTTATTFAPDAQIKRADFAKLLTEADWAKGDTLEKPVVGTAVEHVKAINAKTIEIHFNQAIDEETIQFINVVNGKDALDPGDITQELSEDGTVLTLTATDIFEGEYTIQVPFEMVKDTEGKFVAPVNEKVTVNDQTAPVLVSAETLVKDAEDTISTITLTFDEEVESISNVKIAGKNYTPVVTGKTATITNVGLAGTQSYDVTVVNAKDFADNVKDVQSAELTVLVDNDAPTITNVEATGEYTVKVILDEALKNALTIDKVTGKIGTFDANVVESVVVDEDNNKEYNVTLKTNYLFKNGDSDKVTLTIAPEALTDALGNANEEELTETVTVKKDTDAPEVVNVETTTTEDGAVTGFTVVYNENVKELDLAKVAVENAKGEIISIGNIATAAVSTEDANEVIFTFKAGVTADEYSFDFAKGFVKDESLAKNESSTYSFDVEVTDAEETPAETTFTIENATAENNVITVDFGKKVKASGSGSAFDVEAYELNGVTLPAETEIEFAKNADETVDQTTVKITLPEGFVKENDAKAIFRVTGVETLENQVNNAFMKEVAVTDNTAPEATSFVVTDLNEITVTYSEALQSLGETAAVTDEISLTDDEGKTIEISSAVVTDGKLILTVTGDATAVEELKTVVATTADLKDAANNIQKIGVIIK